MAAKHDLTSEDAVQRLKQACKDAGGQSKWGATYGFSAAQVSEMLKGTRNISTRAAKCLGLERLVIYREVMMTTLKK